MNVSEREIADHPQRPRGGALRMAARGLLGLALMIGAFAPARAGHDSQLKEEVIELKNIGARQAAEQLNEIIFAEEPWKERIFWLRPGEVKNIYDYQFSRATLDPFPLQAASFVVSRGVRNETLTLAMGQAREWDGIRITATNIYPLNGRGAPGAAHLRVENLSAVKSVAEKRADQGKLRGVAVSAHEKRNALVVRYGDPNSYARVAAMIGRLDQPRAQFAFEARMIQENTSQTLAQGRPLDPAADMGLTLRNCSRIERDRFFTPRRAPLRLPVLAAGDKTILENFEARLRALEAAGRLKAGQVKKVDLLQNEADRVSFVIPEDSPQAARMLNPLKPIEVFDLSNYTEEPRYYTIATARLKADFSRKRSRILLKGSLELMDMFKLDMFDKEDSKIRMFRANTMSGMQARNPKAGPRELEAFAAESRRIVMERAIKRAELSEWLEFEIELKRGESVLLTAPQFKGCAVLLTPRQVK